MSQTMNVLVGYSFLDPEVVVVQEARQVGHYKDPEGTILGPEYDGSTESWMNRNDMHCTIFRIKKEIFPTVTKNYKAFVSAANDSSVSDEEVKRRKEAFLKDVEQV